MKTTALFLLLVPPMLTACYSVNAVRIGPSVPPREVGCTIEVSTARRQDLVASYEEVGAICFCAPYSGSGGPPYAPAVEGLKAGSGERRDVEAAACTLGGELIAAQATCGKQGVGADVSEGGTEFGVWRKKR